MHIILRLSPHISPTCVTWIADKQQLIERCVASFAKKLRPDDRVFILADQYEASELARGLRAQVFNINMGNKADTIRQMLNLADNLEWETMLFLEDDYLWKPEATFDVVERNILFFRAFTPYDHPDHYRHPVRKFHHLIEYHNQLYRNCITTTHTFGVSREAFTQYRPHFEYGDHDWQMWTKLDTEGLPVWSPVNSLATHLAQGHLAIGTDWQKLYESN